MTNGEIFVAAGSLNGLNIRNHSNNNPTYEMLDSSGVPKGKSIRMDLLVKNQPYWMYPFLHLMPDSNLFIFAGKSAQIFKPSTNQVIRSLPPLPGMYRTYPNTGGSVMLPLSARNKYKASVMICGGGATDEIWSSTDATCGIIEPLSKNPSWKITSMADGSRTMVEGINLLDGTILWLNGARQGCQGFGTAKQPALEALIYHPDNGKWETAGASKIPRMYHSVALMLLDGTVLVAGSNPNEMPLLLNQINPHDPMKAFPTEFRLEIYTPPYLVGKTDADRPKIIWVQKTKLKCDGSKVSIHYHVPQHPGTVDIILYHGGFVTHALHMGQIMVFLESNGWRDKGNLVKEIEVKLPTFALAPGPYIIFVVADGVPSVGVSVDIMV